MIFKILNLLLSLFSLAHAETVFIRSENVSPNQFEAYVRMSAEGGFSYSHYMKKKLFTETSEAYQLLNEYHRISSQEIKLNLVSQLTDLEKNILSRPLTPFLKELLKKIYTDLIVKDKSNSQKWLVRSSLISDSPQHKKDNRPAFSMQELFPNADLVMLNGFEIHPDDTIYLADDFYQVVVLSNTHLETVQILNLQEIKKYKEKPQILIANGNCLTPEFSQIPLDIFHNSKVIYSVDCALNPNEWRAQKALAESNRQSYGKVSAPLENKNNWVVPTLILSALAIYYVTKNYDVELGYVK